MPQQGTIESVCLTRFGSTTTCITQHISTKRLTGMNTLVRLQEVMQVKVHLIHVLHPALSNPSFVVSELPHPPTLQHTFLFIMRKEPQSGIPLFHLEEAASRCWCNVYLRSDDDKVGRPRITTGARCFRGRTDNSERRAGTTTKIQSSCLFRIRQIDWCVCQRTGAWHFGSKANKRKLCSWSLGEGCTWVHGAPSFPM